MRNLLSVDRVIFKDYRLAGKLVEEKLSSMAISLGRLDGKFLGFLKNISSNKHAETAKLTKEDLENINTLSRLLKSSRDSLILLYEECAIFFNKVAKFNEMPTSFRKIDIKSEYRQQLIKMRDLCVEQSYEDLKAYLLEGNGLLLENGVSNKDIQDLSYIWNGDAAKTVYKYLLKADNDYKKANALFKKEVEKIYGLIEAIEKESQNIQTLEEEQEDSISLKEIEDKILTNEETGKSYLVLDIPEEEMKEEQENLQEKTLANEETGKSYLVIEEEMNK